MLNYTLTLILGATVAVFVAVKAADFVSDSLNRATVAVACSTDTECARFGGNGDPAPVR